MPLPLLDFSGHDHTRVRDVLFHAIDHFCRCDLLCRNDRKPELVDIEMLNDGLRNRGAHHAVCEPARASFFHTRTNQRFRDTLLAIHRTHEQFGKIKCVFRVCRHKGGDIWFLSHWKSDRSAHDLTLIFTYEKLCAFFVFCTNLFWKRLRKQQHELLPHFFRIEAFEPRSFCETPAIQQNHLPKITEIQSTNTHGTPLPPPSPR